MDIRNKYTLSDKILAKTKKIPEDNILRIVKKLGQFFNLESIGAVDFEVPDDVEPSSLGHIECLKIFQKYQETALKRGHPMELFPAFNVNNDIKVTVAEVAVGEEKYPIKQCTVLAGAQHGMSMNASAVGDMLATSYRWTTTGFVNSIQKVEERKLMCVPDIKAIGKLPEIGIKEKNPRQAAYAYFDVFTAKPKISIPLMSDIITKMDPQFYIKSTKMSEAFNKLEGDYKREIINLPKISVPEVRVFNNMDLAYRFHERSKAFRGEDAAGVGSLSAGYPLVKMPRHYAKAWAFCQDLRLIIKSLTRTEKRVNFNIPPGMFILSVLVANGFSCGVAHSQRRFDPKNPVPGLYSYVDDGITYRDIGTKGPAVTKRGITYMAEADFINLLESIKGGEVVPIHMNCYMAKLIDDNKIGLLPSSMAHNGIVYMGIFSSTYLLVDLIKRFSKANSFRNTFVYHRIPFVLADPCGKLFMKAVIFPKTRIVTKKDDLYESMVIAKETLDIELAESLVEIEEIPQDVPLTSAFRIWSQVCNASKPERELFITELVDAGEFYYAHRDPKLTSGLLIELLPFYTTYEELVQGMTRYEAVYKLYMQFLNVKQHLHDSDESENEGDDRDRGEVLEEEEGQKSIQSDSEDDMDIATLMNNSEVTQKIVLTKDDPLI